MKIKALAAKNGKTRLIGKTKSFPINTPTACRWKWAWSSLYLNMGTTASCHRASHSVLTSENFADFHNTTEKHSARQTMLDGKWPTGGCEYCERIETAGGTSDRIHQNTRPGIPPELVDNPTTTTVSPVELEVFIDNTCTFKCLYCSGDYSSKIAAEDKKFGTQLSELQQGRRYKNAGPVKFWPEFVKWFEQHGHSLQKLNILGGEPLYQQHFYELLDMIESVKNRQLDLTVTTNLSVPLKYLDKFDEYAHRVARNKGFRSITLQCSVEGLGAGQEYVRHGFDTDTFVQNFERFHYNSPFKCRILSSLNILVADDMLNLAQKVNTWNQHQDVFWSIHSLQPMAAALNIHHHPTELYRARFQKVLDDIPNKQTSDLLVGILRSSEEYTKDPSKGQTLLHVLEEADKRRASNWQDVFPWLTKYLESV